MRTNTLLIRLVFVAILVGAGYMLHPVPGLGGLSPQVASAVVAALVAGSGTYNVVDDEPVTRVEADRIVAERLGVKPLRRMPKLLLRLNPSTKAVARSQRVGHDRLTAATGWTPAHASIRTSWPVPS